MLLELCGLATGYLVNVCTNAMHYVGGSWLLGEHLHKCNALGWLVFFLGLFRLRSTYGFAIRFKRQ